MGWLGGGLRVAIIIFTLITNLVQTNRCRLSTRSVPHPVLAAGLSETNRTILALKKSTHCLVGGTDKNVLHGR